MKESEVVSAVCAFFKEKGFLTLPDDDRDWGKLTVWDHRLREPDIVAFKWEDEFSLVTKAIECKAGGSRGPILEAVDQASSYKKHFHWAYIATGKPSRDIVDDIAFLKSLHGLGYIPVDADSSCSVDENGIHEVESDYLNTDLALPLYEHTRQKLVMVLAFADEFGNDVGLSFDGHEGYLNTNEKLQYNINSYLPDFEVRFGFNIEKSPNVRGILKDRVGDLVDSAKRLDLTGYKFRLRKTEYSQRRPRVSMATTIMEKPLQNVSARDVEYVEDRIREWKYQVEFILQRVVWRHHDFLSRHEHSERLKGAREELDNLKNEMDWLKLG